MPLRPFSFHKSPESSPHEHNWRAFDQASTTIIRTDLTMTSGTSDPVINAGYFTLYGPLVFYVIKVTLDSNDGWTTSSYIKVPYEEFVAVSAQQVTHCGTAYVGTSGAVITTLVMNTVANPNRLSFAGAYTNGTGADQVVYLQGWYFRN